MIELDVEQLSPEWFEARAGIPTASSFDKIITPTGKPSAQARAYMYQLAGESIIGVKTETYSNDAMKRGIETEAEARNLYELMREVEVRKVGLCYKSEDKLVSCSPDGLIDPNGGVEIKCPIIHTHVGYLLDGKLPTAYIPQVQGSLYITDREWWDFFSYYPGLKPFLLRIKRDEEYILKLAKELDGFCVELAATIKKLREL